MVVDRGLLRLALFLLVAYNGIDARQCKIGCQGASGLLKNLEAGKTYKYTLEGVSTTSLPGSKTDASRSGIKANVEISAGANCEHVITLNGVNTYGSDGKSHDISSKTTRPVKFGLQNGKVEDLCVDEKEDEASLNIKRAVLSLLQSSVVKDSGSSYLHEVDVFGSCPTNFDFNKNGNTITVKKTKDLNKCAHRESFNSPIATASYYTASDVQTSALLLGNLRVEQKFENGVLKLASSEEIYEYNPRATLDSAASIKINTKLKYVGEESKKAPVVSSTTGRTLIFEPEHQKEITGTADDLYKILDKISQEPTVDKDGAKEFNTLVNLITASSAADLNQVYNKVKSNKQTKQVLQDAVFSSHSASGAEFIAKLLQEKGAIADTEFAYAYFGIVKHVTSSALSTAQNLVNDELPLYGYLGLGALGGKFCLEHTCKENKVVDEFQSKLAQPLSEGCNKLNSKRSEDKLIASVKGIGNMRYISKPVMEKLLKCVSDKTVKARVRSAILDTLRTDPHREDHKETLGKIFKNLKVDSELRIKAYLALVECPCGKVASWIKDVLETDKSYQVGAFVNTHLKTLKASTNPHKEHIRSILGNVRTNNRYPWDPRKYSQNSEISYNVDMLNFGGAAESNIIYSQKSFVPRAVSLNLTTTLFGHSFHLLEVDARLENAEDLLVGMLGPQGVLNKQSPKELLKSTKPFFDRFAEKIATRYDHAFRPKRSAYLIGRDIIKAKEAKLGLERNRDIDFDISLKTAGSELTWANLHYSQYHGVDHIFDDILRQAEDAVNGAKNIQKDMRRQIAFANYEFAYPTSMGLLLKLRTLGSGVARVKVDGKIDVPAILKDPKNADIRLQLVPSAALHLSADLNIDGVAVESGVRVTLNVHTSTGSDITLRLLDGKGVDVKFGLPIKKQELISINTEINTLVREDGGKENLVPIPFETVRQVYAGCFDQLSNEIGVTFCGTVDFPMEGENSFMPGYGPVSIKANVDKDDDSLTTYHFRAHQDIKEDKANIEIILDTPNTKQSRKMALIVEGALSPKKYIKVDIISPWTEATIDSSIIDTPTEQSILAKITHDDAEYLLKLGVKRTESGKQIEYTPLFEYKAPEFKTALVGRKGGAKPAQQAYYVSGKLIGEEIGDARKWTLQGLTLHTPRSKYALDGSGIIKPQYLDGDVKVSWDKANIQLRGKIGVVGPSTYELWIGAVPSEYPVYSFDLKWKGRVTPLDKRLKEHLIESDFTFNHGGLPENTLRVFNKYNRNKHDFTLSVQNEVAYPALSILGKQDLKLTKNSLQVTLKGKLDQYTGELRTNGKLSKSNGQNVYNAEAYIEAMGNTITLKADRAATSKTESKYTNVLEIKPGGKYELNANVKHDIPSKGTKFNVAIDGVVKVPVDPKEISVKLGIDQESTLNLASWCTIKIGDKKYIDSSYKSKVPALTDQSHEYKIYLFNYIDSNGKLKIKENQVTGQIEANLIKSNKKMDVKTDLKKTDSSADGVFEICWDTSDRAKKSLKIDTSNKKAGSNHYITKNTVTYQDKSIKVNADLNNIGNINGDPFKGQVEIIEPSGKKLTLEGSGDIKWKNEILNSKLTLSAKCDPWGVKTVLVAQPFDLNKLEFKGSVDTNYIASDKKEQDLTLKYEQTKNDKGIVTVKLDAGTHGQLISTPAKIKFNSEIHTADIMNIGEKKEIPPVTYQLSASVGTDISVESSGKLGGHAVAGDVSLKLPSNPSGISKAKWTTYNSYESKENHHKLKSSNAISWNDKFIKNNVEVGCEDNGINYLVDWESDKIKNHKLSGSAHWILQDTKKVDASATVVSDGRTADISVKAELSKDNSITAHVLGSHPDEGKFDVLLKNKILSGNKGVHTEIAVTRKDKKMAINSKIDLSDKHPVIDINVDHPEGKSRLLLKADYKGQNHYSSEVKAKWAGSQAGSLAADYEVNIQSPENFVIKSNVDAPTLDIKKWALDVSGKPGKEGAKKLSFSVKKEDKIVYAGNANFNVKEEAGKTTLEGSGNVKTAETTYPMTLKTVIEKTKDGSNGKANVKIGSRTATITMRQNPNEIFFERVYCKSEGSCSTSRYVRRVTNKDDGFERYTELLLDLSAISLKDSSKKFDDISYVSTLKRTGLINLDETIILKWSPKASATFTAVINPKKIGASITFPKRSIGVEANYGIVKTSDTSRQVKLNSELWLEKKAIAYKLKAESEISTGKDGTSLSGTAKLSAPQVDRDISLKGKVKIGSKLSKLIYGELLFDDSLNKYSIIFQSSGSENSWETLANAKSTKCKTDITYKGVAKFNRPDVWYGWIESLTYTDMDGKTNTIEAKFSVGPKEFTTSLRIPGHELVDIKKNVDTSNNIISYKGTVKILNKQYNQDAVIDLNNQHAKGSLTFENHAIDGEIGAQLGKKGIARISHNKKPVAKIEIALDEPNFLKSDYSYDTDVIKTLLQGLADYVVAVEKDTEAIISKVIEKEKAQLIKLKDCIIKFPENRKWLHSYFLSELKKIEGEISQDETLKKFTGAMREEFATTIKQIREILEAVDNFAKKSCALISESVDKIGQIIEEVAPKVQAFISRSCNVIIGAAEEALKFSKKIVASLLDELKKHESEIKEYVQGFTDFIHEFGKQFAKVFFSLNEELKKFASTTVEKLRELPFVSMIKEKLNEAKDWRIPEEAWAVYHELIDNLKQFLPTTECQEFVTLLSEYITMLGNRESFDTEIAAKELYTKLEAAVRSVIAKISEILPKQGTLKPNKLIRFPGSSWLTLPKGGFRFSLLNWNWPQEIIAAVSQNTYHPSLNPIDNVPPFKGIGFVLGGSNFITFDGRDVGFKGSCKYVLVEDYDRRSFSVVGHIKDGILKAVTLIDDDSSITLKEGYAELNGKDSELPITDKKLSAWSRPNSIGAHSDHGVTIICARDLTYCEIEISGFFFNRVRGLLGNLNYEAFDDVLTPEGDLAADDNAFANSWKLGSCPNLPSAIHTHARQQECTDLFAKDIQIRIGTPWVDPEPYRYACDHAVSTSSNKQETACSIAMAYARHVQQKGGLFFQTPVQCATCKIGSKVLGPGDMETVERNKAADIILIVEATDDNQATYNDLVLPLIPNLKKSFAFSGVTDVKFTLVSFSPNHPYTVYHTSKGDFNFNGKDSNIKFDKRPAFKNSTTLDRLENLIKDIKAETGIDTRADRYADVLRQFNLRPNAMVGIIGVHSSRCTGGKILGVFNLIRGLVTGVVAQVRGVSYNLITTLEELEIEGKTLKPEDVVAINTDNVSGLKDAVPDDADFLSDVCAEAAMASDGIVIPVQNFKASTQKPAYINRVAELLTKSIIPEDKEWTCYCSRVMNILPRIRCFALGDDVK